MLMRKGHPMRHGRSFLPVMGVVAWLSTFGEVRAQDQSEWFALFVNGKKSGHALRERKLEDGKVRTAMTMHMEIKRGGMGLKVKTVEESIETVDGRPLSVRSEIASTMMSKKVKGEIKDGKVNLVFNVGGQQQKKTLDWPEDALLAEGLRQLSVKKGLANGTRYAARGFVPSSMLFPEIKAEVVGPKNVDLLGRVAPLTEVKAKVSMGGAVLEKTSFVDKKGNALKEIMPMMGMQFEMIACTRAYALSPDKPGEFFNSVLMPSPRVLSAAERARPLTYVLKRKNTDHRAKLANSDEQSVSVQGNVLVVKVRRVSPAQRARFPYKGNNKEAMAAVKPSQYIQSDAKELVELSRKAVGDAKDIATAVKRIRDYTRKYVVGKHLGVGYASALEVARGKQGDCTEHAVFAAALCRAQGIPARVASGLAYSPDFRGRKHTFVPHEWFQVFIDGKWISYDAALSGFCTGHILLLTGHGEPGDFLGILNTLGNIEMTEVKAGKP